MQTHEITQQSYVRFVKSAWKIRQFFRSRKLRITVNYVVAMWKCYWTYSLNHVFLKIILDSLCLIEWQWRCWAHDHQKINTENVHIWEARTSEFLAFQLIFCQSTNNASSRLLVSFLVSGEIMNLPEYREVQSGAVAGVHRTGVICNLCNT